MENKSGRHFSPPSCLYYYSSPAWKCHKVLLKNILIVLAIVKSNLKTTDYHNRGSCGIWSWETSFAKYHSVWAMLLSRETTA